MTTTWPWLLNICGQLIGLLFRNHVTDNNYLLLNRGCYSEMRFNSIRLLLVVHNVLLKFLDGTIIAFILENNTAFISSSSLQQRATLGMDTFTEVGITLNFSKREADFIWYLLHLCFFKITNLKCFWRCIFPPSCCFGTLRRRSFWCILIADECDTEMPRWAHLSSVKALAPPFRSRRLIWQWVALSTWLYWCKHMVQPENNARARSGARTSCAARTRKRWKVKLHSKRKKIKILSARSYESYRKPQIPARSS